MHRFLGCRTEACARRYVRLAYDGGVKLFPGCLSEPMGWSMLLFRSQQCFVNRISWKLDGRMLHPREATPSHCRLSENYIETRGERAQSLLFRFPTRPTWQTRESALPAGQIPSYEDPLRTEWAILTIVSFVVLSTADCICNTWKWFFIIQTFIEWKEQDRYFSCEI